MAKILGLDLGTNSIGWAIVDSISLKIIDLGVVIFKEGVDNLGQGNKEISKNASRTVKRGTRRQLFRRQLRKKVLLKILKAENMCPLQNDFESDTMREWFKLNPYVLRSKALTEKLSNFELGRVFYHLVQRRGFQSNSRSAASSSDGKIFQSKDGKIGINDTLDAITEKQTLGNYLYGISPKEGNPFELLPRIRNRYTTRKMYMEEFEKIWEVQSALHPDLTDTLKANIGARVNEPDYQDFKKNGDGVLFHQRPLRSQKHKIGKCSFETAKPRCSKSCIDFEEFLVYQYTNTIECNGDKLSTAERQIVSETMLKKDVAFDFKVLRKALKKEAEGFKFNYKDEDKVKGAKTIASLSKFKFYGKNWDKLTQKEQEDIWHAIFSFEDISFLKNYAQQKWQLSEADAEKVTKLYFSKDYGSLSRKAIKNILPFLKKGYLYNIATALGGVKNALGMQWDNLSEDAQNTICYEIENIASGSNKGTYIEELKAYLKAHFSLTEKDLTKLYHHSASITAGDILAKLPIDNKGIADKEIGSLRNPVVIKAIFQLRKLVNSLIDEHGAFDEIKIEMGRDLKATKDKRQQIRSDQQKQEKKHLEYEEELKKAQIIPSHINLLKYKLWKECNEISPYSGNKIPFHFLFDKNYYQIEHIHPYSRSLNDSFNNLTLCEADINSEKDNKTPFEYFSDLGNWEQARARALSIFHDSKDFPNRYQKFKQFAKEKFDDDFISRQLNDTRFIAVEAKNYMSKICKKVNVAPGAMTAKLRHFWGLNALLDDEMNEGAEKNRNDHRHHAIDALVLACFTPKHLQEISKWNRYNRNYELKAFSLPWESFRLDTNEKLSNLLVSYTQNNKIITKRNITIRKKGKSFKNLSIAARGQLHDETVYGKYEDTEGKIGFHVRKSLESLTKMKQVNKIADKGMWNQMRRFLAENGVDIDNEKAEIPKGIFFAMDEKGAKIARFCLPNKRGEPVPVYKVRLRENSATAVQLKPNQNQYVEPGNNHHAMVYEDSKGKLQEVIRTFWEVAEAKRKGQPVYFLPEDGVKIIEIVQKDQLFLLDLDKAKFEKGEYSKKELSNHLYRVQKITAGRYYFTHHLVAKLDIDRYKFEPLKEPFSLAFCRSKASLSGFRVKVNISGKVII